MFNPNATQHLYEQHAETLEDFWGRRDNQPHFEQHATLFGRPLCVTSNIESVLKAVDLSLPLFSQGSPIDAPAFQVHFIVRGGVSGDADDPGSPPTNLFALNRYTGHDQWLSIQIGAWGHCQIDLQKGEAIVSITHRLAAHPEIISHGLLNTIFTNLLIGAGFCMLHCSGLVSGNRALLLMAPHNSGKSTTALRLVMAGFQLLSDSQIYISPERDDLYLFGFPVGKAKLRQDMVPHFEQLHTHLNAEPVRNEIKYSLDLRRVNPAWSHGDAFMPEHIDLCLLQRADQTHSNIEPIKNTTVWNSVMQNSIFYDSAEAWQRNLEQAKRLVDRAACYTLTIGTDPDEIVATIAKIDAAYAKKRIDK